MKLLTGMIVLLLALSIRAQEPDTSDTDLPYKMLKNRVVMHTSLGLNDAPFRLKGAFGQTDRLRYRSNMNAIMGLGIAYKWMAININFKLPGSLRNEKDYGATNYFDIGFKFGIKRWYFKVDLHRYQGFAIKNATTINDSIPVTAKGTYPNSDLQSTSFSTNVYRFRNSTFKMKPTEGIVGRYLSSAGSYYMKYTFNIHGISSDTQILPHQYMNQPYTILKAQNIAAIDFGIVPGLAYVTNKDGWQLGGLAGVGGVIQTKFYNAQGNSRGFLGLAPRIDLKLHAGYNVDNWFFMITSAFDNKSIRFDQLEYRQVYYYIRATYGYRFE